MLLYDDSGFNTFDKEGEGAWGCDSSLEGRCYFPRSNDYLHRTLYHYYRNDGFRDKLLRGTLVNRTYGGHKNLYIHIFLLTIFGPIYYRPP